MSKLRLRKEDQNEKILAVLDEENKIVLLLFHNYKILIAHMKPTDCICFPRWRKNRQWRWHWDCVAFCVERPFEKDPICEPVRCQACAKLVRLSGNLAYGKTSVDFLPALKFWTLDTE